MDDLSSILDYATQLSSELQESLSLASSDELKDDIILAHIKKLSSAGTSVLDRDEGKFSSQSVLVLIFSRRERA